MRPWPVSVSSPSSVGRKADILQPWKQLGRRWHLARKGFPLGKTVQWDGEVLEELMELLAEVRPEGQLLWNNKQMVPLYVREQKEPWAAVLTKKVDAVHLILTGPQGRFPQGRLATLGYDVQVEADPRGLDSLRLKFRALERSAPRRFGRAVERTLRDAAQWGREQAVITEARRDESPKQTSGSRKE